MSADLSIDHGFVQSVTHRLTAMDHDLEDRLQYLVRLLLSGQAGSDNVTRVGFLCHVIGELLYSFDGLVDAHPHAEEVRTMIQMRGEVAALINGDAS
ncbi:hypothetical protein EDM22_13795 [Agromyces tardus]|uniref:Uncharacterized protein n=1 Tax=Agromyces tardus TaxID=2583849 RepID=A0A3M8A5P5_9MICO|nr:hypothetical protein [Agromyces tardus]RNB46543.1 hypothetical protein EDM22_13795 [Agromyces tardus]